MVSCGAKKLPLPTKDFFVFLIALVEYCVSVVYQEIRVLCERCVLGDQS